MRNKSIKTIIVSAVGLNEAGPLSILLDFAKAFESRANDHYKIIYLIHPSIKSHFEKSDILVFKWPKKSWFFRIIFEKLYSLWLEQKLKPSLWIALHDVTPYLRNTRSVVYCHNPAPFLKTYKWIYLADIKFFLFTLLYDKLYSWNIKRNNFIIVQQNWIREEFSKRYDCDKNKIIVSLPHKINQTQIQPAVKINNDTNMTTLFYPTMPRVFKNIELVCETLSRYQMENFRFYVTIQGNENLYAKWIFKKYKNRSNIIFLGKLPRSKVIEFFQQHDALVFPSRLETWGLPLSEFSNTGKAIFASDLPYAHETLSEYTNAYFFDPNNSASLYQQLKLYTQGIQPPRVKSTSYEKPFAHNWDELIDCLN